MTSRMRSRFFLYVSKWKSPAELWVILGIALILRLVGIQNIFPSIDEIANISISVQMAGGDLNPHWFGYPTGYFYFLLGLLPFRFLLGVFGDKWTHPIDLFYAYLQNPLSVTHLFRVAGILVSVLAIFFTYLAAEKIVGRRWAWLAGLFLAVSPFASHWSIQIWPEALIILPSAICLFFCIRYTETGRLRHILICGLAAGAAVSVKYNAVYLCAIIPCAAWVYSRRHEIPDNCFAWKHIFLAALASLVGFFILTPFALLDWRVFVGTFADIIKYREEVSHVGLDAGYQLQRNAPWIWWSQTLNEISPGFVWIIIFSLILALLRWKKQYFALIGPVLVMLPFLPSFGRAESYHVIPILPVFGCMLSIAAQSADTFVGRYRLIVFFIACAICLPGFQIGLVNLSNRRLPDTRIEARYWIEDNIPNSSRIILDKFYVPHLLRTKEQVQMALDEVRRIDPSEGRQLALELEMPRQISYWIEVVPIIVDSRESYLNQDGSIAQPELITPQQYADRGFDYVILSSGTYSRFNSDARYQVVVDFYRSFFEHGELIYEIKGDESRLGPTISIIKINLVTP